MDGTLLKTRIEKLVDEIGPKQVQIALVSAGVGVSTAEKLVAGRYVSNPKGEIARAIEKVLRRRGVGERSA